MNTSKTSRSLSACLLALVALPVLALSEDGKKDTPAAADAAKPRVIDTIDCKDLTYGELIDLLRKESGANIMLAPVLQNEKAPQIVMRHVTVGGVLDAICWVTGLNSEARDGDNGNNVIWDLKPQLDDLNWQPAPKNKICRVFKASAKEKLAWPQLDQLLAKISDAARKIGEVEAKAGHPAAEAPVIEAHAETGIVIVAGTESDVQLVGQVIQAVGGEVVPLTSSVMTLTLDGTRIVAKDMEGTRQPIEVTGGNLTLDGTKAMNGTPNRIEVTRVTSGRTTSSSSPLVTKAKDGTVTEFEGFISGSRPITSVEDARKLLEVARDKVKNLEKQLELLSQQQPPTPPTPPKAK